MLITTQNSETKKMNKKDKIKNQIKKDKEMTRIKFALTIGI